MANIAFFAAVRTQWIDGEAWVQDWQDPLGFSLVGSAFLQFEWLHLVPNLIYLWVLGKIVEGTTGTGPFLLLCLGIILGANGMEAAILHGREGGSYGASGLAFGLLAAAFLIAPRSKVHCFFGLHPLRPKRIEVSLGAFAAFIIGIELFKALRVGFQPSSALLHVLGVAAGGPLAYLCLKFEWLDAGGWDWLSLEQRAAPTPPRLTVMDPRDSKPKAPKCNSCGRPRSLLASRCIYCGAE